MPTLGTVVVGPSGRLRSSRRWTLASRGRRRVTLVATGLATGLLAAVPSHAVPSQDLDLHLSFDRVDHSGRPLLEAVGSSDFVGSVSSAAGGAVVAGPDRSSSGHSLRMERFRAEQPAQPAVVVVRPVVGAADPTDPGTAAFAFGAHFALDEVMGVSATDNGDNLVQRGLAGAGPQYKIQLDGGRPVCRIDGSEGAVVVRATERVESGQWYRVRCRRVGDTVTLRVATHQDSAWRIQEYVETGSTGSLSFHAGHAPFSIGGKVDERGEVLAADSDQFNGLVDDVVFRRLG